MTRFLEGLQILVVDDDYFAAIEVQETVESLGGIVVGPSGRLDQARELARAQRLDGAILDVRLDSVTSYPLARELLDAGIPVLFLTAYDSDAVEAEFRNVPRLSKPYDARVGEATLRIAFGAARTT